MHQYVLTALAVIIPMTVVLFYIFKKKNLLDLKLAAATVFASLTVCIVVPVSFAAMFDAFSRKGGLIFGIGLTCAILLSIVIYIALLLFFAVLVSLFPKVSSKKVRALSEKFRFFHSLFSRISDAAKKAKLSISNAFARKNPVDSGQITDKMGVEKLAEKVDIVSSATPEQENTTNTLGFDKGLQERVEEEAEYRQISAVEEQVMPGNTAEAVIIDSVEGMEEDQVRPLLAEEEGTANLRDEALVLQGSGVSQLASRRPAAEEAGQEAGGIFSDPVPLSDELYDGLGVDECINKAFDLKEARDLESAVTYYLCALNKNPERDVAFLIALDACAILKELGRPQMAKNIIEKFKAKYGNFSDISIGAEIEDYLF